MKISVLIPSYNAAGTLTETLDSVLQQTVSPYEVLVLNDGSTDNTAEVAAAHPLKATVIHQPNAGISGARNALCRRAQGDVIAFLDSDDVWHPRYLEFQQQQWEEYPKAVALFTSHYDLFESSAVQWDERAIAAATSEVWEALPFIRYYHRFPGRFANLSHCCVPKRVLDVMGDEPFQLKQAEDLIFTNRIVLHSPGPVVYCSAPLCAYRVRSGSLSWNRLVLNQSEVRAFEFLTPEYGEHCGP